MDVSKIQGPREGAHTPGPWEVFTDHRGEVHVLARHSGSIAALNRIATDEGIMATARLIAAAPELLAALRDCVSVMSAELNGLAVIQPELRQARAAIDKAIGSAA